MKLTLAFLLIGAVVATNAQFGPGGAFGPGGFGFGGGAYPPSTFYQTLLERQLQKLLTTPDFPEDLADRAIELVANAETAFDDCSSAANPMPWMQKVCASKTYSRARMALTAIENEATARAQSTTAAPTAA